MQRSRPSVGLRRWLLVLVLVLVVGCRKEQVETERGKRQTQELDPPTLITQSRSSNCPKWPRG